MAYLGTALIGNITSHTDAEKKFRYMTKQTDSLRLNQQDLNRKYA